MKRLIAIVLITISTVLFCSAQSKITIAVAANMQYAVEALKAEFNKTDKTEIEVVLGASGNLTQQIMQNAPFDIFISADTAFTKKLEDAGLAAEPPKVYARGLLVLWTTKENIQPGADLKVLPDNNIQHIAIANPKTAPYGAAAEYMLRKYGIYDKIAPKLVTGESITQTSHFIVTGAADIGFTAKSIVISDEMKGRGKWVELDQKDYPPIKQAAVLLTYGQQNHAADARKFYDFLYSDKAQAIYKKFGYMIH
jgi:molybdate transport system substrate-binding protein